MNTDLLIDGMLSGTGVRDALYSGYLDPEAIGLSSRLASDIADWQRRYEVCHFAGFPESEVASLDEQGQAILARVRAELPGRRIGYFSNGRMTRLS